MVLPFGTRSLSIRHVSVGGAAHDVYLSKRGWPGMYQNFTCEMSTRHGHVSSAPLTVAREQGKAGELPGNKSVVWFVGKRIGDPDSQT